MAMSERNRVVSFPGKRSGEVKSPGPVDRQVGARIRLQRTLIGMSQERLGELLGLTFQQVQKYEKGTNRVGAGRLLAIAEALGVSVTYFFEEFEVPTRKAGGAAAIERLLSTREGVALAEAFLRIENPTLRRALVELARATAECFSGEKASSDE
jgi:transcriptional regulator with XRE-family HTH domain